MNNMFGGTSEYNVDDEMWVFHRPSVAEMKRQYEEMVDRLNKGDPVPFRSNNVEKVMYLRRKRLQDQVPTQDKRPKIFSRFSLSIPLKLNLPEIVEPEEEEDDHLDPTTNTKKIESIEEWWGDFHSPNISIKYLINIGSLSVGDQAVIELSQKLTALIAKMPAKPTVLSLDISWNDLYEEGMVAFCAVLEQLSGLMDVRMDGNQMGTAGLEAVLKAMLQAQPQERKRSAGSFNRSLNGSGPLSLRGSGDRSSGSNPNSPSVFRKNNPTTPGFALTLRETNIGDESTQTLAKFLKPLPDSKQLNLVSLDLTNTYIFDGITAITLALQSNTTLTNLVLNSNMIGDQGAFAIGELLLKNQTLIKLDIRNCDIGPTGTSHLCEGLQGHKGLLKKEGEGGLPPPVFTIDVGLNPWEFSGELLLLQTAIAKPDMNINWREGEWTPNDDEEMETLIRTFGETAILERLMEGKGLLPLASPTQLVSSPLIATYAPIHVATVVDSLNPLASCLSPTPTALPLLSTIVELLQVHGRTNFRSWMSVLPSVLNHLVTWMNPNLITNAPYRRQIEVLTIDLLLVLSNINQHIIEDIVVCSGIVPLCLENFLAYPNHNVFHLRLLKLVDQLCANQLCGTLRGCTLDLITDDFLPRLLEVIKEQSAKQVQSRTGSFNAAVMFARQVEPHLETRLALSIKKAIKSYDEEQKGGPLGGPPPARTSSKLVLNKDAIE